MILADLLKRVQASSSSLIEQHLFNVVFKLPVPSRNKLTLKYPLLKRDQYLEIAMPNLEELPYANHSHFEMLMGSLSVHDIVEVFTHMLFE